jgi:AAA domain
MNVPKPIVDPPIFIPPSMNYDELARLNAEPLRWLWHGYLAAGSVTLLTSRWKAGKTTLISLLLANMRSGGVLAGFPVAASRAVVLSEETPALWAERGRRLGFGPHLDFLCRPFRGKPSASQWDALLGQLVDQHARERLDLVVIDPLPSFLPGSNENSAAVMLDGLAPLQRLTAAGIAVMLLHHPRKLDGQPRGSGALPGFADILIEMSRPNSGDADCRRRTLLAASRFSESPAEHRIELSPDGTMYTPTAPAAEESFAGGWPVLRMVLEDARFKLTRREVKAQWPQDYPPPGLTALWEWLEAAVASGLVVRSGRGRRKDPYRYCLTGREDNLRDDLVELEDLPPLEQDTWTRMATFILRETQKRL